LLYRKALGLCLCCICCFFFFLAVSVFSRPYLELVQSCLHLYTKTAYLCFISAFQILVVIIKKTVKFISQTASGFLICILITIFIAIIAYIKPYNDKRALIYQLTSLSCSLWGILVSSVFISFEVVEVWLSLELGGFFIILCVGTVKFINRRALYT
jgi:hypothetical protein